MNRLRQAPSGIPRSIVDAVAIYTENCYLSIKINTSSHSFTADHAGDSALKSPSSLPIHISAERLGNDKRYKSTPPHRVATFAGFMKLQTVM